jgi:hypothetical protein
MCQKVPTLIYRSHFLDKPNVGWHEFRVPNKKASYR